MAVDWLRIKTEYINGHDSYRALAKKYGVSESTLGKKAVAEGWAAERETQRNKIETETQQKTAEKIAESESEVLAIKSRLKLKMYQQIEKRMESADDADGQEFRRLVQNYKDMCDIQDTDGKQQTAVEDDPLTKSLKEAADALAKANENPPVALHGEDSADL